MYGPIKPLKSFIFILLLLGCAKIKKCESKCIVEFVRDPLHMLIGIPYLKIFRLALVTRPFSFIRSQQDNLVHRQFIRLLNSMTSMPLTSHQLRQSALEKLEQWLAPNTLPLRFGSRTNGLDFRFKHVSHDPATGKPLVYFDDTSNQELDDIILAASLAQKEWSAVPGLEKSKMLCKMAHIIRSEANWLSELETLDTGKPLWEAYEDIKGCADTFELFAGYISSFHGVHVPIPPNPGSFYYTRREPFGVCAGIGAWNFPLQMAVWKSAPALAVGNALVFKPSPLTPLSTIRLCQLYELAGFPKNLFSVVLGGIELGQALINHRLIAKVSFTGSVNGGCGVLQLAANRIIPATVELGGKSALIIMPDANLDEAIKGTLMANFYTQGEVCSNAARVFVHKSIFNSFKEKLVKAVRKLRVGDPFDGTISMGALITPEHKLKVCEYIKSALAEGAELLIGGTEPNFEESYLDKTCFLLPCVLTNCHDEMRAVREEIFGPVLILLDFNSEDEIIERANQCELGLAGGVFSQNISTAHRIAAKLQCGSVYINTYNVYSPGIPFGGYKRSGFGRENSEDTLLAYSQIKSVYVEGGKLPCPFPLLDL